ncbi:hypothetical protein GNI_099770 [Gregarina niphandrodes]|uniref:Uncharacterized protein n=1 Tax=Gregarina niphandrodes TaxID=110365 RepID=A0A023B4P1_GRENI|nr:hypothetical protein GNI_099770 [Gregarina niphandrodes]EZG57001.1 hypothetical protein GNI_099770 [Gregarina niphandrodes]|eukprot:XP_011131113.1 hypothetical protein GNI_099770 [Gregarina niphandrodes]
MAAQDAVDLAKKEAEEAKEDAERKLKQGIQFVVVPEEVRLAKERINYPEDVFHFAAAGPWSSPDQIQCGVLRYRRDAEQENMKERDSIVDDPLGPRVRSIVDDPLGPRVPGALEVLESAAPIGRLESVVA